ncbi:MAG: FkbM family methyltransferase [Candidatus Pacebacteria bacterium]|nr:FkbM family methyltransferase [Candidatus Paceibacterota bacterium]
MEKNSDPLGNRVIEQIAVLLENPLPESAIAEIREFHPYELHPQKFDQRFSVFYQHFLDHSDDYSRALECLKDEHSRAYYEQLILLRILGPGFVLSPINNKAYWDQFRSISAYRDPSFSHQAENRLHGFLPLVQYILPSDHHRITLLTGEGDVTATYLGSQYCFEREGVEIKPLADDIVIDAGGYHADSALKFADLVGADGFVYSFEIDEDNLAFAYHNLQLNLSLAPRVEMIQKALSNDSNKNLYMTGCGAGCKISDTMSEGARLIQSITIDDFVTEQNLARLNFIKMDIEGAELEALKGAVHSLIRFRPKLAICIYHNQDDFFSIINYLHSLELGYEFYIDHYTAFYGDTLLYAHCKGQN